MTHSRDFGKKFTAIRRFSAWKTHPFWLNIPNMTQCGSAPLGPKESKWGPTLRKKRLKNDDTNSITKGFKIVTNSVNKGFKMATLTR